MRVSIVVTYYNRPERFSFTLESLLRQTYKFDEVLIADDCSPSSAEPVVRRFSHRFESRFEFIRHKTNLGMPGNLNYLLARATGDIIINLHDADEIEPRYIETLVGLLRRYPHAGLAFTAWRFTDARARRDVPEIPVYSSAPAFFDRYLLRALSCPIWGTVALRKQVIDEFGALDPQFGPLADIDMWSKVALKYGICYCADPLLVLYPIGTHGNEWRWERYEWGRRINRTNLIRRFSADGSRRRLELLLHEFRYFGEWIFGMLHLVKNRRWSAVRAGIGVLVRRMQSR